MKYSEERILKMVEGRRRNGSYESQKGENNPARRPEIRLKISLSKLGNKNPQWKDKPSYSALHVWVYNRLGKPKKCENCGKDGLVGHNIEWANKSGKYLRDIKDWIRLCVSCHRRLDRSRA